MRECPTKKMSSYQRLKWEMEQLSKLWKIAREAMMHYAAQTTGEITKKDLIIINALNETGRLMHYEADKEEN